MKNKNSYTKHANPKKYWPIVLVLLVLVGASVYLLFIKKHTATSGTIPATTTSSHVTTQAKSSNTSSTTNADSQKSTGTSTTNGVVSLNKPPTGTFVSNHHPSLSGSTKPSGEQSTCNTAPGATCYIKFTSADVVKTLPSQVANSDGTVIWNWDVAKAGFTEGSWKITAVAQANDQSFATTDSMDLEVQP